MVDQDAALFFAGFSIGSNCVRVFSMESVLNWKGAKALLEWQIELGATEAIVDQPVDRYSLLARPAASRELSASTLLTPGALAAPSIEVSVAAAERAAAAAANLVDLKQALASYPHCKLKQGARNLVFADGNPAARVMIIGEAPGRDEDLACRPFVGRAGQLLDKMLAAITLDRTSSDSAQSVYITNIVPWRPPQNRDPRPEEIAMMVPFVARHVALINPAVIVLMGNVSCQAVLGKRGITRLRGIWAEAWERPVLPMLHPAYLLRKTEAKREAWADLLALRARLAL